MADATVALNARFAFLDDDRLRNMKPNSASRERAAVVDITLSSTALSSGLFDVDFSTISQFTEVYSCSVIQQAITAPAIGTNYVLFNYVPGTGAVGEFLAVGADDGVAETAALTGTITVEIRGI